MAKLQVEPHRVQAIGRWAAKHTKLPPPARLHESIKLVQTDSLGLHAVSNCSFAIGDPILKEDALLRIPDLPLDARGQLERRFGPKAPFVAPAISINWPRVPDEVVQATLSLFWAHPLMDTGRPSAVLTEN